MSIHSYHNPQQMPLDGSGNLKYFSTYLSNHFGGSQQQVPAWCLQHQTQRNLQSSNNTFLRHIDYFNAPYQQHNLNPHCSSIEQCTQSSYWNNLYTDFGYKFNERDRLTLENTSYGGQYGPSITNEPAPPYDDNNRRNSYLSFYNNITQGKVGIII